MPTAPVRPNRPRLYVMLLGLAFGAGCGLVFLLEMRDDTIRRPSDIDRDVVPHLVAIPFIETKAETRQRHRKMAYAIAAVLFSVATMTVLAALLSPLPKLLMNLLATLRPGLSVPRGREDGTIVVTYSQGNRAGIGPPSRRTRGWARRIGSPGWHLASPARIRANGSI